MASWLKVAEDLFEVVDRRAKLVVSELSEEQSNLQPLASKEQESYVKKKKTKDKGNLELYTSGPPATRDTEQDHQGSDSNDTTGTTVNEEESTFKILGPFPSNVTFQPSTESPSGAGEESEKSVAPSTQPDAIVVQKPDGQVVVESSTESDLEPTASLQPSEFTVQSKTEVIENSSSAHSESVETQIQNGHHPAPADSDSRAELETDSRSQGVDQQTPELETRESHESDIFQPKGEDILLEPFQEIPQEQKTGASNSQQEQKGDTSVKKVQDQLDEAQGLLKSAPTTGQSKEARLARVCAGLSSRLQEYKSENAQLEELLTAERERRSLHEAHVKQLQQELSMSKSAVNKIESNMADALAAKNSEIEALVASMDAVKKQAAISEGQLASFQVNMETIMRSRELTETRMMQALREELATAERRAEEVHAAHNATKMAAMEREVELEHRAVEASSALAKIQRIADERTARATELEQKLALLEVECASLNQELQDLEARARRGEKRSPEEANQALKAWQEEVERARQGQKEAENKLSSMEAELQKMRVEMAGMKRDAEHYSRQEHMELEKRYRELTDLLYYKQTQLEAMASEKAAAEFQLEKEAKRLQEAQIEAERSRVSRRASSSWEEDADFKALEPLPLHHRHMVGASIQLQKAVKLIDSGAVSATRFLWRYPIARVILLFYLVFVHLFLMFLMHRLQEQADSFASKDVAASMGFVSSNLP